MRSILNVSITIVAVAISSSCGEPKRATPTSGGGQLTTTLPQSRDLSAELLGKIDEEIGRGSFETALELLKTSSLTESSPALLLRLARLNSRAGDSLGAKAAYERLLVGSPNFFSSMQSNPAIWFEFGNAALDSNDLENSNKAYERVIELAGDLPSPSMPKIDKRSGQEGKRARACLVVGHHFRIHGQDDEALDAYMEATKLAPDWELAKLYLVLLQQRLNGTEAVIDELRSLERSHDPVIREVVARYYQTPVEPPEPD